MNSIVGRIRGRLAWRNAADSWQGNPGVAAIPARRELARRPTLDDVAEGGQPGLRRGSIRIGSESASGQRRTLSRRVLGASLDR